MNEEQIERVIRRAERAARGYISSKLPKGEIEDLEIAVEVETDGDLTFNVEVCLDSTSGKGIYQQLVDGAVDAAHAAICDELEKLAAY